MARAMSLRSWLRIIALSMLGCGPPAEPAAAPSPSSATSAIEAQREPDRDDESAATIENEPEHTTPRTHSDAELDEMERSELEAACFAGSSSACDRLGH